MELNEQLSLMKQDFYQDIKKYLTLDNYNNHTFWTPTSVPKFYLPKSQQIEGWTEEEWFNSLIEKIYLQLNIQTTYQLHRLGALDRIKNSEFILMICSAFFYQLESIIYNNCWITSLSNTTMTLGSNSITSDDIYDDFWFPQPYMIFKSIGLIDQFGRYQIDLENIDYSKLATKLYVDQQDELMLETATNYAQTLDTLTNQRMTSEVETLNARIDNEVETLDTRIDNEVSTLNDRVDNEVEIINTTILDKQLLLTHQLVDYDNQPLGEVEEIGKVKQLKYRAITRPEYDEETQTVIFDTLREIPMGTDAPLSPNPIARPQGDEYAITAGWAYDMRRAFIEFVDDFPNFYNNIVLNSSVDWFEDVNEIPWPIEEPEEGEEEGDIEELVRGGRRIRSHPISIVEVEGPSETEEEVEEEHILEAPSLLEIPEDDPLRLFKSITNKKRIAETIAKTYDTQMAMKQIIEDHDKIIDFMKSQGVYLEQNAEAYAKLKEEQKEGEDNGRE